MGPVAVHRKPAVRRLLWLVTDYGLCVGVCGFLSSLQEEIRALHLALEIADLLEDSSSVLICSDSKSALEGLHIEGVLGGGRPDCSS